MPKHRAGKGIAGKHTTIIDAAEPVVDALLTIPNTRVVLGIIKKVRSSGKRRIKFFDTVSGFSMKITGNVSVQELHVIIDEHKCQEIKEIVSRAFNSD